MINKLYTTLTKGLGIHRQLSKQYIKSPYIDLLIPPTNIEYMSYQAEMLIQAMPTRFINEIDPNNLYQCKVAFPINKQATILGRISNQINIHLTESKILTGDITLIIDHNKVSINGKDIFFTITNNLSSMIKLTDGVSITIKNPETIITKEMINIQYQLPFNDSILPMFHRISHITKDKSANTVYQLSEIVRKIMEEN